MGVGCGQLLLCFLPPLPSFPDLEGCLCLGQCGRRTGQRVKGLARSWLTRTVVTWWLLGCDSLSGSLETPAPQRPESQSSCQTMLRKHPKGRSWQSCAGMIIQKASLREGDKVIGKLQKVETGKGAGASRSTWKIVSGEPG